MPPCARVAALHSLPPLLPLPSLVSFSPINHPSAVSSHASPTLSALPSCKTLFSPLWVPSSILPYIYAYTHLYHYFLKTFYLFCVGVGCMCHSLHVASKDNLQEMCLPSTTWARQIEVRSSGEVVSASYH